MTSPATSIRNNGVHLVGAALFGASALALTILCNLHWPSQIEALVTAAAAVVCSVSWWVMHTASPHDTFRTTLYVAVQATTITLLMQVAYRLIPSL